MKAPTKVNLAALSTVPFVMVLSNSMLIPVLPALQKALRISAFEAGLIITAFSIPAGLTIPVGGYLSDRFGRKAVITPALALFGLGGLTAGLAPILVAKPFWVIFASRILQGIGGGGTYQVAMALAGDIFRTAERAKALAILEAANGLGKVVAPIIGAAAALLVWYAPYFVYPALAWPAALAVAFLVKEPGRAKQTAQNPSQYGESLLLTWRNKGVSLLTAFAAGMTVLFVLFGLLSYYSDILETRWKIGGFAKGFVMAVPVLVMAVTAYLTGLYLQRRQGVPVKAILVAGLAATAAALAGGAFLTGLYGFSAALAVTGLGNGLALASLNQMVTSAVGASERGIVTSLYGTVRFFGAALGPPVAGRLFDAGQSVIGLGGAFLVTAVCAAVLLLIDRGALAARPDRRAERRPSPTRAMSPRRAPAGFSSKPRDKTRV